MMYDISVNDLRDSPTASLEGIKKRIEEELQRRRNLERQHLINEFQKAWCNLKEAHIIVTYSEDCWDDRVTRLNNWDGFDFD